MDQKLIARDVATGPTIVLIHGAWMSPTCWDKFKAHYEAKGYPCVAPAWPYDDRPVDDLRRAPSRELARLGVAEIVDHYASVIGHLDAPPLLIGHSFGGLFVQMLLDRGLAAAGVAIDSAPPKGVLPGLNSIRAGFPVLRTWRGWKKVLTLSFKSFQWGWVSTRLPKLTNAPRMSGTSLPLLAESSSRRRLRPSATPHR